MRWTTIRTRGSASGLARLPPAVLGPAMERLETDLADGTWHARHRDLLERDELDAGYRLVVAGRPSPARSVRVATSGTATVEA